MLDLPEGSWWDWEVICWNGGELRLAADYDLTYSHGLEVVFTDPLMVVCPSQFSDPCFRAPTEQELAPLVRTLGELPPVVVAFEADAGGTESVTGLIAAETVTVVQGLVMRGRP